MTHTIGGSALIEYNNKAFKVQDNQLLIKVGKQRGGFPSGKSWFMPDRLSQKQYRSAARGDINDYSR